MYLKKFRPFRPQIKPAQQRAGVPHLGPSGIGKVLAAARRGKFHPQTFWDGFVTLKHRNTSVGCKFTAERLPGVELHYVEVGLGRLIAHRLLVHFDVVFQKQTNELMRI